MMNGKSWYRSGGVRKAAAAVLMMVMLCLGGVTCAQAQEQTLEVNLVQSTPEDGYLLVPGVGIAQDIAVEVSASTGDSYVYVRITETNNQPGYLSYELEEGWLPLTTPEGTAVADVYYREHNQQAAASWPVLKDQQIMVNPETMTRTVIEQLYQDSTRSTWPSVAYEAASIALQETDAAISAYEGWRLINGWKWNIESEEISEDEAFEAALNVAEGLSLSAYDVKMVDENGSIMQPDGAVEVRLPAAAGAEAAMVLHVLDDHDAIVKAIEAGTALATPKGDGTAVVYESIEASVENGYAVFNATSFSTYYVVSGHGETLQSWWSDTQVSRYNFDFNVYGMDADASASSREFKVEPDSTFYVFLSEQATNSTGQQMVIPVEGTWSINSNNSGERIMISTASDGLGRVIRVSEEAQPGDKLVFTANNWTVTVTIAEDVVDLAYNNSIYPVYIGITLNGTQITIGKEPRVSGHDNNDWVYVTELNNNSVTLNGSSGNYQQYKTVTSIPGSVGEHFLTEEIKTVNMLEGTDDKSVKGIIDHTLDTGEGISVDVTKFIKDNVINWELIKDQLISKSLNPTATDNVGVNNQNKDKYELRPYVVKLQTDKCIGWHINACLVPRNKGDQWIYFDENLDESIGQRIEFLNMPARQPWPSGSTYPMYTVDPQNPNSGYTKISVNSYVTLTNGQKLRFLGWNTKDDGSGDMFGVDTSFNSGVGNMAATGHPLQADGTLYAFWGSTLDRVEIRKEVVVDDDQDQSNRKTPDFTFQVTLRVPEGVEIEEGSKAFFEIFSAKDNRLMDTKEITLQKGTNQFSPAPQFNEEEYGVLYAPKGVEYSIEEQLSAGSEYNLIGAVNNTGTIQGIGNDINVRFTNGWNNTTGLLRVSKKVELVEGQTMENWDTTKFPFTITFTPPEGQSLSYKYQRFDSANNAFGDPVEGTSNLVTIELAHNESVQFEGLKDDTKYQVTENLPADSLFTAVQTVQEGSIAANERQEAEFINKPKETNGTLTIIKAFRPEGYTPEAGESFVFTVKEKVSEGVEGVEIADVVIYGEGSKTLSLPYGTYTVTEDDDWSWRYTATAAPESGEATISSANPTAEITFTNTKSNNNWLDGSAGVTNTFTSQPTVTEHGGEQ